MGENVHASLAAIQNMEAACERFARVVLDRLPSIERELQQVSEALDERRNQLRREISSLHDEISSAEEEEDTSWARSRLDDAEEELASVERRSRRLAAAGATVTGQVRRINHLATDQAVRTREFLRGTADDLKAYFAKTLDNKFVTIGSAVASANIGEARAAAPQDLKLETGKPPDVRVSAAIEIATGDKRLVSIINGALAAIDEVHRDGTLPLVPVRDTNIEAFGYFRSESSSHGFTADHLAIKHSGPWPELTMVHEIGHLLDLEGIGSKGSFATKCSAPVIQDVLLAANNSNAIRGLKQMRSNANSPRRRKYLDYLLSVEEVWARAYAQFVAERSGNRALESQLQSAAAAEDGRQWTTEDFAPIDAEIEKMFDKLGWL